MKCNNNNTHAGIDAIAKAAVHPPLPIGLALHPGKKQCVSPGTYLKGHLLPARVSRGLHFKGKLFISRTHAGGQQQLAAELARMRFLSC